jgi:hypothetical protein
MAGGKDLLFSRPKGTLAGEDQTSCSQLGGGSCWSAQLLLLLLAGLTGPWWLDANQVRISIVYCEENG